MVFDRKKYDKEYYQKNKERIKARQKEYLQKNPEYHNKYYQENKEKRKEYNKKNYQENKEKRKEQKKKYYKENKEKRKEYTKKNYQENKEKRKEYNQKMKELVYNQYSNGVIECACCGEKEIDFLSLDHIYNNGGNHRKKIGGGGDRLLRWAIKNNFPPIFQLLCMNCNFSKGKRGNDCKCIHQIRREEKEKRKQEENQP